MEPSIYDLNLLLDASADDARRTEILGNVEELIRARGTLIARHDWGVRPTAYEVHKTESADYRLIQFQGDNALLEALQHNLRITDGIVRSRIIKLRPGTPPPPDLSVQAEQPEDAAPVIGR